MIEGLSIREATDADAAAWNAYLDGRDQSSPLARYEWRAILERSYGVRTLFLLAESDGRIVGLLPVYETAGGRPRKLHSLRFGFVVEGVAVAEALLARLAEESVRLGASRASVTSGAVPLETPWPMRRQTTVVLELAPDEQTMWRRLRDKTRNMIRKAERGGIAVAVEREAYGEFHALYASALLSRGIPVHREAFFDAMAQCLGERLQVLTARREGRLAAGMLLVLGRDSAAYPFQAVTDELRNSGAVQRLNWEAMRLCGLRGVSLLEMGESKEGGAVYQSKVNFGGAPRSVYYYDWPPPPSEGGSPRRTARSALDEYLLTRAPLWLRRPYAYRKLKFGRLL